MTLIEFKKEIQNLLTQGFYKNAIDRLCESVVENSMWKQSIIQNSGIFEQNESDYNLKGIIPRNEYELQRNKVSNALLTIANALTENDLASTIEQQNGYIADIAQLDIEPLGKIQLVNSDRQSPFSNYTNFFRQHLKLPHQFYFIVGCPDTQQPRSFAERAIYDIIENVLIDETNAIDYEREIRQTGVTTVERIKIPNLPLGIDADTHQRKFRKYFATRLARFNHENVAIEDFIVSKTLQLPFKYFTFIFQIDVDLWDTEVTKYLQWLIETFKKNAQTQPTFLFFLVVNFRGAYKIPGAKPLALETILTSDNADICCLITDLIPMSANEISNWFQSGTEYKFPVYKINNIITKFTEFLVSNNRRTQNDINFNMVDVEELQEAVYVAALKNDKQ